MIAVGRIPRMRRQILFSGLFGEQPLQIFNIHLNQDAFLSRSATNTLMIDCRGTPRRFASLSNR